MRTLSVAGLFAGIGGLELGLSRAGHKSALLCEIDDAASAVLKARFPDVPLHRDIRDLRRLPSVDLIAAGFPCQDLSQAGNTKGIRGARSGLVAEVFRLLDEASPRWVLLENVSFMLSLDSGRAMTYLTRCFAERGYSWAYRVVDTRAFGLPQRRQRVLFLASRTDDPRNVLLADDDGERPEPSVRGRAACGFYWTEGIRGLGWAVDAVPTLKGGSTIGIPSPPAIWLPNGDFVTPEIRDAERLQGFAADWTKPAMQVSRREGARWKLVGNAVSVPVAAWVGRRLKSPGQYAPDDDATLARGQSWPKAAWCVLGEQPRVSRVSTFPLSRPAPALLDFLKHEGKPLSARATEGFLRRTRESSLRFPDGFIKALHGYLARLHGQRVQLSFDSMAAAP
jgi:DNA (cytosine-5)-methyltransferase 1